ncbi:MAG: DUF5678 domain-containing protein [Patescibacteria group bacterium]
MEAIDWKPIYKKYHGQWVALDDDEVTVIASGKTALEALAAAQQVGKEKPILAQMPEKLLTYVGSFTVSV